jgi:phage baseplate assembly protein W
VDIAFPYRLDPQGTTATAALRDAHIAQMLEQLLFTRPGERVNRPTFGCGLLDLVFSPNSPEVAAALRVTVSGAIQQEMSDLVKIQSIDVTATDSTLRVVLAYLVLATGTPVTQTVLVPVG